MAIQIFHLQLLGFRRDAPFSAGCQVKHSRLFETTPVFQASFHSKGNNQQVRNYMNDVVAATSMTKLLLAKQSMPLVVAAHFQLVVELNIPVCLKPCQYSIQKITINK